jgi:hypothetical protein
MSAFDKLGIDLDINKYSINTSYSYSNKKVASEIGLGLLSDGMSIFQTLMMAKIANSAAETSTKAQNSAISSEAKSIITNYPAKMTQATSNFNQKYSGLATIDENGIPSRTYGQIKADIEGQIKDLQASIPAGTKDEQTGQIKKSDGQTNLEKYNAAKQNYDNMCALKTDISRMNTQMKSIVDNNQKEITVTADGAKANAIDIKDYYQYLTKDELESGEKDTRAKNTDAYKAEQQKRENLVKQYNDLAESKKTRLANANVNEGGIDQKITDAEREMNALADGQVNGTGITAAQYNETLQRLQGQLAKLGTEAEFNQAVNEIKSLNDEYKAALELQSAEQSAQESANAVKNNKKTLKQTKAVNGGGIKNWLYRKTHSKSIAASGITKSENPNQAIAKAKVNYSDSKEKASTSQQLLQSLYQQYYES